MRQFYTHSDYTDALLNIAAKHGASDRIAAYEYCMNKKVFENEAKIYYDQ